MTKNCKECNSAFEAPSDPILSRWTVFCPKCSTARREAAEKAERERVAQERESRWQSICPPAYRDTVPGRLPNPARADDVLAWNYGPQGLLLHGETRRGKSRCAWLLVRKMFDAGKSIRVMDSRSGFDYGLAFASGAGPAQNWVDVRCRCGVLFLDDVFKVKLTDSFEAALFAIVEYRCSHRLPILATLNDTGETLAARLSPDRGDALVARFKEMCQVIEF